MENPLDLSHGFTRRGFLGAVAGAAASLYGFPPVWAAEVPRQFDGSTFQLRAPEPKPKSGGVLRYGVLSAPAHFDVH